MSEETKIKEVKDFIYFVFMLGFLLGSLIGFVLGLVIK